MWGYPGTIRAEAGSSVVRSVQADAKPVNMVLGAHDQGKMIAFSPMAPHIDIDPGCYGVQHLIRYNMIGKQAPVARPSAAWAAYQTL